MLHSRIINALKAGSELAATQLIPCVIRCLTQAERDRFFARRDGSVGTDALIVAASRRQYAAVLCLVEQGAISELVADLAAYFNDVELLNALESSGFADYSMGIFDFNALNLAALRGATDVVLWFLSRAVSNDDFLPGELTDPSLGEGGFLRDLVTAAASSGNTKTFDVVTMAVCSKYSTTLAQLTATPFTHRRALFRAAALSGNSTIFDRVAPLVGSAINDAAFLSGVFTGIAKRVALSAQAGSSYAAAARGCVKIARRLLQEAPRAAVILALVGTATHQGLSDQILRSTPTFEAARAANVPALALYLDALLPGPADAPETREFLTDARARVAAVAFMGFIDTFWRPSSGGLFEADYHIADLLMGAAAAGATLRALRSDPATRARVRQLIACKDSHGHVTNRHLVNDLPAILRLEMRSAAAREILLELLLPRHGTYETAGWDLPHTPCAYWPRVLLPFSDPVSWSWKHEYSASVDAAARPPLPDLVEPGAGGFEGAPDDSSGRDWALERAAFTEDNSVGKNRASASCIADMMQNATATSEDMSGASTGAGALFTPAPLPQLPLPAGIRQLFDAGIRADDGTCALCRGTDPSFCEPASGGCIALRNRADNAIADQFQRICAAVVQTCYGRRRKALRTLVGHAPPYPGNDDSVRVSVADRAVAVLLHWIDRPAVLAVLLDAFVPLLGAELAPALIAGMLIDPRLLNRRTPDEQSRSVVSLRLLQGVTGDAIATSLLAGTLGGAIMYANTPLLRCCRELGQEVMSAVLVPLMKDASLRSAPLHRLAKAANSMPQNLTYGAAAQHIRQIHTLLTCDMLAAEHRLSRQERAALWGAQTAVTELLANLCTSQARLGAQDALLELLILGGAVCHANLDEVRSTPLRSRKESRPVSEGRSTVVQILISMTGPDTPITQPLRRILSAIQSSEAARSERAESLGLPSGHDFSF